MVAFDRKEVRLIQSGNVYIHVFSINDKNIDARTVESFGEEWTKFNYFKDGEIQKAGDQYFDIIPGELIKGKEILDVGCGTGRWTKYLLNNAKFIDCIDPSDAVYTAANFLKSYPNVRISKASVEEIPFPDNSFDFVFSLGVLHHIPDTERAMKNCINKVKVGGHFMVYLYYNLDNRGILFKLLFNVSDFFRKIISGLPAKIKRGVCDFIAILAYMPFVGLVRLCKKLGLRRLAKKIPLSYYADHSFNIIKNDALDRFGTPLEKRFSKKEIKEMMERCGLINITFSENEPYWHAFGQKL